MRKEIIIALLVLLFLINCGGSKYEYSKTVKSPDGNVCIEFILDQGVPKYSVGFEKQEIIKPSNLGFIFKNIESLAENFSVKSIISKEINETWKPVWGTVSAISNHCNELQINLIEKGADQRKMSVIFRAYNDGAAFRYIIPEQENIKDIQVTSEETQFNFAGDYTSWWIMADWDSYEHLYNTTPLSKIDAANTPVTMETSEGICISIHEANLTDYAGMTLKAVKDSATLFECDLVPWPDSIKVKTSAPMKTPWRTIQLGDCSGDLVESHLIQNLNEPCALSDVSWIIPMKYVGIWWGMHIDKNTWYAGERHGATTVEAKKYIDFAAEHNIPAVLIEGWNEGWESWLTDKTTQNYTKPYPDFDIEEVIRYGANKYVSLIGHHETGGNVPNYENQIEAAFTYYNKLGISSVKTGYAGTILPQGQHHHGQWMVKHYRDVVKRAAKHKISIDAHEPIKATGISRTYPNMMTREGARGMEYNAWSDGNPPEHTTILPFTRFLGGPMDYTPGIFDLTFDEYKPDNRVYTTLAKQLAYYVVLYSPLQMAADLVENYEAQPAFEFIEKVPVNWDDTKVLDSKIGDFVTIARKNGTDWYIGSITDENSRNVEISLDFLEKDIDYSAHIFSDSSNADWENNPTAIEIGKYSVNNKSVIKTRLAASGGVAIHIYPKSDEETVGDIEEFNIVE